MNERGQRSSPGQHRVLGEDAPGWLTVAFGVAGLCVAAAAAWLWVAQGSLLQERKARQAGAVAEQPLAAGLNAETKAVATVPPAQVPATPAPAAEQQAVAQGSTPAPAAALGVATNPSMAAAEAKADPQSTVGTITQREDCPSLVNVTFKFNSAQLSPDEVAPNTAALVEALRKHPEAKLYVQGYSDTAGQDQYNLLLSYRRAKTIVALLTEAGVPEQRMVIRAVGSHEPIEGMPADDAANRRVTLQVTGIAGCS